MSCFVFKCSVNLYIEFTTSFASKTSGSDHSWLDVKGGLFDFSPGDITTLMTCRTSKTPLCATGKPFDGDSLAVPLFVTHGILTHVYGTIMFSESQFN